MKTPSQRKNDSVRTVACSQCGCLSGLRWLGWRACRIDDPEFEDTPEIAFFCPTCASREFGDSAA